MTKLMIIGFVWLAVLLTIGPNSILAHMGEKLSDETSTEIAIIPEHGESVEMILDEMLANHQVSTLDGLSCDQVDDNEFERLGDALMGQLHPGPEHEVMDSMMGGNNIESLRRMHINMGRSYLGCGDDIDQNIVKIPRQNDLLNNYLEGFSMMGINGGMMGGYGLLAGTTWIALVAFLLSGVYFFLKQANKK